MIFKIFSPKKFAKKLAFLTQNKAKFWKKIMIITLFFEKNANFFRLKLSKIAENCDHNIDQSGHPARKRNVYLSLADWLLNYSSRTWSREPPCINDCGSSF
jgi:hypothetical protein